jgi:hypothetical protein
VSEHTPKRFRAGKLEGTAICDERGYVVYRGVPTFKMRPLYAQVAAAIAKAEGEEHA